MLSSRCRPLLTKLVRPSVQRWTQPTVRTIYTNQNKPDSVDNVQRDLKNPGKSKQEVQKAKNIENEVESDSQNMSDKQDSFSREVPNLYQSDPIFGDNLSYQTQMDTHNIEDQKPQHTGTSDLSSSQQMDSSSQFNDMKRASKQMEWSMRGGPTVEVGGGTGSTQNKTTHRHDSSVSDIATDPDAFSEDNLGSENMKFDKTNQSQQQFERDPASLPEQLKDNDLPGRDVSKQSTFNQQQPTTSSMQGDHSINRPSMTSSKTASSSSASSDNTGMLHSTAGGAKISPPVDQKGPSGYGVNDIRDEKKRTI